MKERLGDRICKFGQTLMHLSKIGILGTLWSEGAYLLHLPNPVEAPADAGAAPPDPTRLLGRSVAVCALVVFILYTL